MYTTLPVSLIKRCKRDALKYFSKGKEAMNLKESVQRCMGGVGRRKGKEESCNYNFKNKAK